MSFKNFFLALTLRHKIYLSLTIYIFIVVLLGSLSFFDLIRISTRMNLLVDFDHLTNVILEVRRFEKNFLLYKNRDNLDEARSYMQEAEEFITQLSGKGGKGSAGELRELRATVDAYSEILNSVSESMNSGSIDDPALVESLRSAGKKMVDLAEFMGHKEKQSISIILRMLKMQLIVSVLGALLLGIVGTKFLFGRLFNAMDAILGATRRIGRGKFDALPEELGAQQETRRIIQAFNQMVHELERRQEQLVQAQKLSSLGTLTAGIAHQLNNPLNNISTSSQIAMEELEENDLELQKKMLGNIEQESARAKDIVQGLLEFSRERTFSPRNARLDEVVRKTLRLVSSQVPPAVEIKTDIPDDLELPMDVQRLQEALLNLIINATQAMPEGRGRISLSAGILEGEDRGKAFISVADTGSGIPKELVDKVFDPFFTTKEERVGTGLGLSIVYGIVDKHGGSIHVQSRENEGTEFTIKLPLYVHPLSPPDNAAEPRK